MPDLYGKRNRNRPKSKAEPLSTDQKIVQVNSLRSFVRAHGGMPVGIETVWTEHLSPDERIDRFLAMLEQTREHTQKKHAAGKCCMSYKFKLEDGCTGWVNSTNYICTSDTLNFCLSAYFACTE